MQPAHMAGFIVQGNVVVQGCVHASGAEAIGIPQRQRARKEWLTENPNSATAVVRTLTAVIFPVPKRVVRRSLFKTGYDCSGGNIIEMMPAEETEVPSS